MKEFVIKYWRKDYTFNKCCWSHWKTTCKAQKKSLCLTLIKTELQMDQGSSHNAKYPKYDREKSSNMFEFTGTGKNFLQRTLVV